MDIHAIIEALGITKQDVINRAAQELADDYANQESVGGIVRDMITKRIESEVQSTVRLRIEEALSAQFRELLTSEIVPLDMWGDPVGKPTTIRDQLAARARTFWEERVDKSGSPTTYGGKPRHEWMFKEIVGDEFAKAISQNYTDIVGAIKDTMKEDARKQIDKHIDAMLSPRRADFGQHG